MKRKPPSFLAGVVATALALPAAAEGSAETFRLKPKRLGSPSSSQLAGPEAYIYRMIRPVSFSMRPHTVSSDTGATRRLPSDPRARFSKVVRKEPAAYRSEHPFRGVTRFGSEEYGFVFDCEDGKSTEYGRLYFDSNHNGDLTDDKVIEGKQPPGLYPRGYCCREFPCIEITVDADGASVDYAFFFSVYSRSVTSGKPSGSVISGDPQTARETQEPKDSTKLLSVTARLVAGLYREGEITLGGKPQRVMLVDRNSNGRFDDEATISKSNQGEVSLEFGDVLLVAPDPDDRNLRLNSDSMRNNSVRNQVTRLVNIDGAFYDLSVSPAGDKLTLTPAPIGHLALPADGFRATLYGEKAVFEVSGDRCEPAAVPAGEWNLMYYTIDLTGRRRPAEPVDHHLEDHSLPKSLAASLAGDTGPNEPRSSSTRLVAEASHDSQTLRIRGAETVTLPFGPPYRPIVTASDPVQGGQQVDLELSLVGSGGERCTSLALNGQRPPRPEFTISTSDGEIIETAKFDWG